MIFFFLFVVLKYSCHVCFMRIANQTRRLHRVVDTASTHFWFQCDFDFDTNFVHDTIASIILWMLDWMKLAKTFICSTLIRDDDATNSSRLLRNLSTFMRFHALLCLNDIESTSSVSVIKVDMWFNDWLKSKRVSQLITLFTNQLIMKTKSIVLFECFVFQIIVFIDNVSCLRVCKTTFMSWFAALC
jgi:hypothetical protein